MRMFKALASCAALLAVAAVIPSAAAGAAPDGTAAPGIQVDVDGPWSFVHEVTGTYLKTDYENDDVGQAIQVWNAEQGTTLVRTWYTSASRNGYRIESGVNRRCLTASATSATDFARLALCDGGPRQDWIFSRIDAGPGSSIWAISPYLYPQYALAIRDNSQINNWYVVPTPTWGGKPSHSQYWQLVNPLN